MFVLTVEYKYFWLSFSDVFVTLCGIVEIVLQYSIAVLAVMEKEKKQKVSVKSGEFTSKYFITDVI
jgi:hypothetical protein